MAYLPYETLLNGSYFSAATLAYDLPLGNQGWFYVILYMIGIVIVAIYTESPSNTVIASILGGIVLFTLMPTASIKIFYAIAVFALTVSLAKFFSHKQGSAI
jgi:hypothetical membrane protein